MAKIAREYLRTRHDAHTQCAYDTLAAAASHTVHLSWLRIMLIRLCSSGSSSTSSRSSELFATCCQALCAACCCCCCYFVVAVIIVIVLHFTDIVVPSIKGLFYAYISNELQQQQQQRSRAGSRTSRILCKLLFAMKTIVVCCCMCIGMHIAMPYLLRVSLSLFLWAAITESPALCIAASALPLLSPSLYCAAPASVRSFRPLSATGIFGFV